MELVRQLIEQYFGDKHRKIRCPKKGLKNAEWVGKLAIDLESDLCLGNMCDAGDCGASCCEAASNEF
jgi:hypothetical protein